MLAVEAQHGTQIQVGDHIAVEHQKGLVQTVAQEIKRTHRPQRLLLLGIVDLHVPAAAVAA